MKMWGTFIKQISVHINIIWSSSCNEDVMMIKLCNFLCHIAIMLAVTVASIWDHVKFILIICCLAASRPLTILPATALHQMFTCPNFALKFLHRSYLVLPCIDSTIRLLNIAVSWQSLWVIKALSMTSVPEKLFIFHISVGSTNIFMTSGGVPHWRAYAFH